ncbi:MAG: hypothetical protein WDN04_22645 [Rhodospirillales bacterium]
MKHAILGAFAALAFAGAAVGQTAPSTNSPSPPAVATGGGDSNTNAAPVAGKNSFTEAQARARLRKHGYHSVSALTQDDQSIWRGTATKHGKKVDVAVDYQGNIVPN